jgi:hypothetical protein
MKGGSKFKGIVHHYHQFEFRGGSMLSITLNQLSKTAAAGAFVALTSLSIPAAADEVANLGPVGPHAPILTSVGDNHVIAFYLPGSNQCALNAVVWDKTKADSDTTSARIWISLEPGQIVHIDSAENESTQSPVRKKC